MRPEPTPHAVKQARLNIPAANPTARRAETGSRLEMSGLCGGTSNRGRPEPHARAPHWAPLFCYSVPGDHMKTTRGQVALKPRWRGAFARSPSKYHAPQPWRHNSRWHGRALLATQTSQTPVVARPPQFIAG